LQFSADSTSIREPLWIAIAREPREKGTAEGMYSAWSNPEDCKKNGIPRAYSGDYEPNNESNANYTGGDNSATEK